MPHCSGTGDNAPDANTRMREMKAEGGWGVVCTEIAEVANTTEFWPSSELTTEDILDSGARHIVIATGALWRRDGIGRFNFDPVRGAGQSSVITPDDAFEGVEVKVPPVSTEMRIEASLAIAEGVVKT